MTVRVGLIGVGGIAQAHINALSKINSVNIVAVYDVDVNRAEEVAHKIKAQVYQSIDEVLNPKIIDALFICSPQFARGTIEEDAARRGIHLLAEKPLGLDLDTVRRKEEAILASGIIHSSGYCLRYLDTVQRAKKYLSTKQVDMVMAYRFGGVHPPSWWSKLDMSGGMLVDTTTHQVDMVRYTVGEFKEVYAMFEQRTLQRQNPEATISDVGSLSFRMKSGAVGNINNGCLNPHYGRAEVEILGSDFYVQLDGNGTKLKIVAQDVNINETSSMDVYYEQDKRFIEAVESGSQENILCSYGDALQTLAVTLAANRSASEKKAVSIS